MDYLDRTSLFKTVDQVSEALFFDLKIDENEKVEIADFIVNQQSKPHAYADTFAPTEVDLQNDFVLFTGERIKSTVGKCHMIGEEASRVLRKLGVQTEKIKGALHRADTGLQNRLNSYHSRYIYGMYCCKSCSCGLWLNLSSGGLNKDTQFLIAGMDYLRQHRDGEGKWKGFPYFYALYVLHEIGLDIAKEEMKYTARSIESRLRKKRTHENKFDLRRNYICEQILEKISGN
jgi:hypothetical protein